MSNSIVNPDDRAQAMAVISGIAPKITYPKLRSLFANTEYASPYMERYVLEALCEMNYPQDALNRMRSRYKPMADSEHTTLWERFELTPNSSYNHAWSGAPLIVLSKHIAGITPVEPGFRKFRIKPQLCDLEYIRTCVPTKYGNISLYICRKDGLTMQIDVPQGTDAQLLVPAGYTAYHLNGKKLKPVLANDTAFYEINLSKGYYVVKALCSEADTTGAFQRLANGIENMKFLQRNTHAGNEMGNAPEDILEDFNAKADSLISLGCDSANRYETVFRAQEAEMACERLFKSTAMPMPGDWFRINADATGAPLAETCCDTVHFKLNGIWIAGKGDGRHSFCLNNAANGNPFADIPMQTVPGGKRRVALYNPDGDKWLQCSADGFAEWVEAGADSVKSKRFGYRFAKVNTPTECYRDTIGAGKWNAVMLPVQIDSVSNKNVSIHRIGGLIKDNSGETIGIKVSELCLDTTNIAAGTPVIFHADSETGQAQAFSLYTTPSTKPLHSKGVSNGLYGTTDTTEIKQNGTLVFENGVLKKCDSVATILPGYCYITPKRIQERNWATTDIIPVVRTTDINGIKTAKAKKREDYVDVYNLDGTRIRKHVKRSNIDRKLPKGIYITDGEKHIVK